VAEKILNEWFLNSGVEIFLHHRLDSVIMEGNRIIKITMENGTAFCAELFIDASYEGDLMARAGISYEIGRESRAKYGESYAGIKEIQPGEHQISVKISPYDNSGKLLPYVIDGSTIGAVGDSDNKVQAYCFRVCLTDIKENQIPITRPDDYDPKRYELLKRFLTQRKALYKSIGMGGYNMDVREVQWIAKEVYWFPIPKRMVLMEGYFSHPVEPYEIPYRCLLPQQDECRNLLVTSCVSASHMAYSSLRMEPQYIIMGHAAGVAAALVIKSKRPLHLIDISELQGKLRKQKQILSLEHIETK